MKGSLLILLAASSAIAFDAKPSMQVTRLSAADRNCVSAHSQMITLRGRFSPRVAVGTLLAANAGGRAKELVASTPAADAVPGRSTVLASSISFIIASTLLLAEFVAIAMGKFSIVNYLGAASCVGWVVGFVMLINWIVFSTFPVWGFDKRALTGATIKLIAACFFNIQPWSWIIAPGYGVPGIGVPWSNFVGAWMFHIGNSIDAVGMAPMFDKAAPFALANWPVLGMWTLTAASTFLSVAGTVSFFNAPATLLRYAVPSQILGSFLLLVGSVMYTYWSCTFGKIAA